MVSTIPSAIVISTLSLGVVAQAAVEKTPSLPGTSSTSGMRGLWSVDGGFPMESDEVVVSLAPSYAQLKDFILADDFNAFAATTMSVAWAPAKYLELGLSSSLVSNYNTLHVPASILVFGDPVLRLKAPFSFSPDLAVAVSIGARFPTAAQNMLLAFDAPAIDARAALSWRPMSQLRVHSNLGVYFDRSAKVVSPQPDVLQRYVGRLGNGTSVAFAVAADYGFELGELMELGPFVAFNTLVAPGQPSFDDNMMWASLGAVWSNGNLELTAGLDVRVMGAPAADSVQPGLLPFLLGVNLAYHFGRAGFGEARVVEKIVIQEKIVEKPVTTEVVTNRAPPTWTIAGRLVDAKSKQPITRGVVELKGSPISPLTVASDAGAFTTYPLESEKPVMLAVTASGYLPRTMPVSPLKEGTANLVVELQPAGNATGTLKGSVKSINGKPLKARIFIPQLKQSLSSDAATGLFAGEVPVGSFEVVITANRHRMQKKQIEIRPGDTLILNIDLKRR